METVILLGKGEASAELLIFAEKFGSYNIVRCSDNIKDCIKAVKEAKYVLTECYYDDPDELLEACLLYIKLFESFKERKKVLVHGYLTFIDSLKFFMQDSFHDVFTTLMNIADFYELDLCFEPHEMRKLMDVNGEVTKSAPVIFNHVEDFKKMIEFMSSTITPLENALG